MAFVIAFAGKGGTGKTTLAGLTIRYLIEKKGLPILAVDADANNCLNEVLGVDVHATIGSMREDALEAIRSSGDRPGGMSMEQLFSYRVQHSVIESKGFDLIVMGRPEGPGCYCAANNLIRKYTDKLSASYPYVVIDNEAGLEHLSRRTIPAVNILVIVSDPSAKGIVTAKRIAMLADEVRLSIERKIIVINKAVDYQAEALRSRAASEGLQIAGIIPADPEIEQFDLQGRPLLHVSRDSPALRALSSVLDSVPVPQFTEFPP